MINYINQKYGSILHLFEEAHGLNGMDLLWSLQSREEVDELLSQYLEQ